jgi:glycerol-3-phosphate acyltransferase PlsY
MQLPTISVLVLSYLIGAIPFAVLVGKRLANVDVQHVGSGNAGALNTFRSVGRRAGVLVALLDVAKAALAMLIGRVVAGPDAAALCGAAAVAGHCFSPYLLMTRDSATHGGWKWWLRRTGGKGLASGLAVLTLIAWPLALITMVIFGVALWCIKDVTWPTIIALAPVTPLLWWWTGNGVVSWAVLVVSVVVIVKHFPDLREGYWVNQKG